MNILAQTPQAENKDIRLSGKKIVDSKSEDKNNFFETVISEVISDENDSKNKKFLLSKLLNLSSEFEKKEQSISDFSEGKLYTDNQIEQVSIEDLLKIAVMLKNGEDPANFPTESKSLKSALLKQKTIQEFKLAKNIEEILDIAKKNNIEVKNFQFFKVEAALEPKDQKTVQKIKSEEIFKLIEKHSETKIENTATILNNTKEFFKTPDAKPTILQTILASKEIVKPLDMKTENIKEKQTITETKSEVKPEILSKPETTPTVTVKSELKKIVETKTEITPTIQTESKTKLEVKSEIIKPTIIPKPEIIPSVAVKSELKKIVETKTEITPTIQTESKTKLEIKSEITPSVTTKPELKKSETKPVILENRELKPTEQKIIETEIQTIQKSKQQTTINSFESIINIQKTKESKELQPSQIVESTDNKELNDKTTINQELKIQNIEKVKDTNTLNKTFSTFAQDFKEKVESYKAPLMKIKMELKPAGLGEVDVTLVSRGNNLQVNINSNANTIAMFAQNQVEFKNSLISMGFSDLQMNFGEQQKKEQERQNSRNGKSSFEQFNENEEKDDFEIIVPRYV